uniref:Uncharacterized protein n=1 Tax=viral metagenome TaxID=1070528 RepID=A0A6C0LXT9_9ZZZZ
MDYTIVWSLVGLAIVTYITIIAIRSISKSMYTCNSAGVCVVDSKGKYGSKAACDSACKLPGTRYDCDSSGACVETTNGKYTTMNCDNSCKGPAPQTQYDCDTTGKCVETKGGRYTTSDCDKACKSPISKKYACNSLGVCGESIDGKFTTPDCDKTCKPPPQKRYDCNVNGLCVETANGKYTSINCNDACNPPPAIKYSCDATGSCTKDAKGTYTTSDCDNSCKGPAPQAQYDCDVTGNCVPTKGGRYMAADCGNSCKVAYSCDSKTLTCSPDKLGMYGSKALCDKACVAPKVMWTCLDPISKTCVTSTVGKYSSESDCKANCPYDPPSHYDCDPSGECIVTKDGKYATTNCDNKCVLKTYGCDSGKCVPMLGGTFSSSDCGGVCVPYALRYGCNAAGMCVPDPKGVYSSLDCNNACMTNLDRYLHDGDRIVLASRRVSDLSKKWQYVATYTHDIYAQLVINDTPLALIIHKLASNPNDDRFIRAGDSVQFEVENNGYLWLNLNKDWTGDKICGKDDALLRYSQPPTNGWTVFIINNGVKSTKLVTTYPVVNDDPQDKINYVTTDLFSIYSPAAKRYMTYDWCDGIGVIFSESAPVDPTSSTTASTWMARVWTSNSRPIPWVPIGPTITKFTCDTKAKSCVPSKTGQYKVLADCMNACSIDNVTHYSCDQAKGYCAVDINGLYTDSDGCDKSCSIAVRTKDAKYLHDKDSVVLASRRLTDKQNKWQYVDKFTSNIYGQLVIDDNPLPMIVHKVMDNAAHKDSYIRSGDTVQIEVAGGGGYLWASTSDPATNDKVCGKDSTLLRYSQPATQQLSHFVINNGMPIGDIVITQSAANTAGDQTIFTLYSPYAGKYMTYDWCAGVSVMFSSLPNPPNPSATSSTYSWILRKW